MKRMLCLLLTLSLLCASAALAEETRNTEILYVLGEPQTEYTVIIPPSLTFETGVTEKTMNIAFGEGSVLAKDESLSVKFVSTDNGFRLKQAGGDGSIAYTVKMDGAALGANQAILSWKGGEVMPEAETLTVALTITGTEPAGDYSDTMTFEIVLDDAYTGGVGADDLEDGGTVGFW